MSQKISTILKKNCEFFTLWNLKIYKFYHTLKISGGYFNGKRI